VRPGDTRVGCQWPPTSLAQRPQDAYLMSQRLCHRAMQGHAENPTTTGHSNRFCSIREKKVVWNTTFALTNVQQRSARKASVSALSPAESQVFWS